MPKKKPIHYPHTIYTDQDRTVIKLIPGPAALKEHICLFCGALTEFYQEHVLLLPVLFTGNRRYAHKSCYEDHIDSDICMHPEAPYLTPTVME